jgi:predicted DNA-binding antitoxin AbrB/MazE fold protein
MKTVHAVFEDGVFKPTEPVQLPEKCEVEFEPKLVSGRTAASVSSAQQAIYELCAEVIPPGKAISPSAITNINHDNRFYGYGRLFLDVEWSSGALY